MTPPMETSTLSGRDVLVHQALLYGSEHELVEAAVPYLRTGTECGDAVVAITTPGNADLLRGRLGEHARPIEFIDSATWFQAPMQALAAYFEHTRDNWWPRGRLRLFTEPLWAGRTPLEIQEWKRHEAILNVVFADTPSVICCAYDAASLKGDILADAARTHPELVAGEGTRPSDEYTDPADFYAECNALPLSAPPAEGVAELPFSTGALPAMREFVSAEALRHGLAQDRLLPLMLAVNEVATNIIRHGSGHGGLWMWAEGGELICDLADPERALEDTFLGYQPPRPFQQQGAGMWAVRRLCHIVEIRSGALGTVIRIHVRL